MGGICMQESDKVMVRKRSALPRRRKAVLIYGVVLIIIVALCAFDAALQKPLRELACEQARAAALEALNSAVIDVMCSEEYGFGAEEFTRLDMDENGAKMLMVDARRLNILAARIAAQAQLLIGELGASGVSIPLGTASGIALFTGAGPQIRIEFVPVGSVSAYYSSSLSEAGINQTKYTAALTLQANVRLALSGSEELISVTNSATVCEALVVGEVPQVYTNVGTVEDALNLIPTDIP